MRKILTFSVAILAVLALSASGVYACDKDGIDASQASAKSSCSAFKNAKLASSGDKAICSQAHLAACAAKMGMSAEEIAKYCGPNAKGKLTMVSVQGMTCGGCERSVKAALAGSKGVIEVVSISQKEGTALVFVDSKNFCKASLTKAVADKGFEASIIPAVARTTASSTKLTSRLTGKGATCGLSNKAACSAKAKASKDTKKIEGAS